MIFGQEAGRPGKVARVIPFALGGAVALACFALLGWDLAHHYIPYSQPPVRKPSQYLALIYLVLSGLSLWRDIKRRRAKQKAGVPGPGPVSDNSGAVRKHPSESADEDAGTWG